VINMKGSSSLSFLGSEFEPFLLAPIGEDNDGMVLSVLSALAASSSHIAQIPSVSAASSSRSRRCR
jgi:predicted methyltransferase MtxX (methanogen marker protein 4)